MRGENKKVPGYSFIPGSISLFFITPPFNIPALKADNCQRNWIEFRSVSIHKVLQRRYHTLRFMGYD